MERRKLHNTYGVFATKHEKLVHPSPSQTTKKSVVPAFREGRGLGIVVPDAAQRAVVEDGDDDEHEHGEDEVAAELAATPLTLPLSSPGKVVTPREVVGRVPVRPKLTNPGRGMKVLWDKTHLSEGSMCAIGLEETSGENIK